VRKNRKAARRVSGADNAEKIVRYAQAYGIALVIFLILDGLWLGVVARGFYTSRMGDLLASSPRWGVAAVFYALYVVGLVYFAVNAGFESGRWQTAALNGALFGFFSYMTYNATALSVIRGFDSTLAVVDTLWGTIIGALVAGATTLALLALARA
jgi:uncharacterized membrane protein